MKHNRQRILLNTFLTVSACFGVILSSHGATADSTVDSIKVTVPVSCTMSSSISAGNSHQAEIANGIYKAQIGTTNIRIVCNDYTGFSLYAVGFTDDIQGKTVLSSSLSPSYDIITGTADSGDTSNWAMKIDTDSSATYAVSIENGFNNYSLVPSRYTKIATRNTETDAGQTAVGVNLTTTYAAYINNTQPAGSYIGQVKYILVHPYDLDPPQEYETEPGYIGYYSNATSYVGNMERQPIRYTDVSATLKAPNYIREGYGFAGWNTAYDYSGTFYGPNETITFDAGQYTDGDKGLSLYAVWVKTKGTMQNWQSCSTLPQNAITALTDSRDNNTYAVAKLADNQCWIIENMRLDDTVDSQTMSAGSDSLGYGFTTLPLSSNNWVSDNTLAQFNDSNLTNDNNYSYGGYYSWPAAVASSASYVSGTETTDTSICPLGWRLPTGGMAITGSDNDFYILIKTLTNEEPNRGQTGHGYYEGFDYSNSIRKYPNNFVYSGYWDSGNNTATSRDTSGFLWTATTYGNGINAYYFYLSQTRVRPGDDYIGKYHGNSFRCISSS